MVSYAMGSERSLCPLLAAPGPMTDKRTFLRGVPIANGHAATRALTSLCADTGPPKV